MALGVGLRFFFFFDLVPLFLLIFFSSSYQTKCQHGLVVPLIPRTVFFSFFFFFFFGGLYPSSQILYAHRIWNLNRIGLHNKMKWIMRFHWARLYTPLSRIWNLPIPPRMRLGIYFLKWFFSILLHVHTAHLQPTVAWWTTSTHTILSVKAKSPFPVWMTAKKWGWLT